MWRARIAVTVALVLGALTLGGCGGGGGGESSTTETAATTEAGTGTALKAKVGPGFEISLTRANGDQIAALKPGDYSIEVDDESSIHNFHLTGPGVDEDSGVSDTGRTTWNVALEAGSYHFQCDPHADQMNGDFEVSG